MMQESALLSAKFRLSEYEDAKKIGRWTTSLLFSAVRKLSEKLDAQRQMQYEMQSDFMRII